MPKINLLDSSVYNRIAAGEVVQQPSSVVKELLENSIDSGATQITLEIKEGGIREIRVSDNGCGIDKSDLKNAFLPHATSKVKDIDDLDSIATLGFRGEALSSIASVSIVETVSKTAESDCAYKISIRGGEFDSIEECAQSTGTTITVQNLFYNTPARAKFLKKPYQEEAEVTAVIQRIAFANPTVAFTYITDDKIVFKTSGDSLLSTICSVYGHFVGNNCVEVSTEKYGIRVNGYICAPSFTKPNRNFQTIIVNGRFIKDFGISSVVSNAYGERLMKRNFPVFILDIVIPFADVDVNVHPAKTEVRFKKQSEVYGSIYNAVKNALEEHENANALDFDKPDDTIKTAPAPQDEVIQQSFFSTSQTSNLPPRKESLTNTDALIDTLLKNDDNAEDEFCESAGSGLLLSLLEKKSRESNISQSANVVDIKPTKLSYGYTILGQLFDCYLLIQHEDKFIIIDQHAAHERLLYDELISQAEKKSFVIQPLLLPYVSTYNAKDFARIMDIKDGLNELGIEIEEFGKYTIKISALPLPLVGLKLDSFLNGFLSDFDNRSDFTYADLLRDKLAARACRSAIKAGDRLQKEQIDSIINQIIQNKTTLQCPHGRPIAIIYSKTDIEKLFKRIV